MVQKLDMSYVTKWGKMWRKEDLRFRSSRHKSVAPKVDRWAREHAHQMPYFIKVITASSSSNPAPSYSHRPRHRSPPSMCLPAIFVRENFRKLQRNTILEGEFGKTWEVSFVSASASPVWRTGWTEFAVDNHLVTGDIVLFVLVANSHFRITIFDKHESLKKTANCSNYMSLLKSPEDNFRLEGPSSSSRMHVHQASSESGNSDAQNYHMAGKAGSSVSPITPGKDLVPRVPPSKLEFEVVVVEISDTEEDLNEPINRGHGQSMNIGCYHQINRPSHQVREHDQVRVDKMPFDPLGFTFISKREVPADHKRKAAKHAGETCVRTLKRPSIMLVMEDSHVYQDFYLELPHTFAAKLSLPASVATTLDFVDMSTGQPWEMQICRNSRNKFALHRRRWAVFSLHHFLEEGVLELMDLREATLIQVGIRIFRIQPLIPNMMFSIHDHYDMRVVI